MTQDTVHDQNTSETLTRSLDAAGIQYELDAQGNVKVTPEIVEFLESKSALTPDTPVVKTEDELLFPDVKADERSDEEKGYSFTKYDSADEVETLIKDTTLKIGESDLTAKSDRHRNIEVYIGPVTELQGLPCLVQRHPKDLHGVSVQFDDKTLVFEDRALGYGWHDFPSQHISDTRPFLDKWRDLPSKVRGTVRKKRRLPRLHPSGERFLTPKESRRGVVGAFGGPTAKLKRLELLERACQKAFLLNIICEDPEHNKTIAVRAGSVDEAKGAAWIKHHNEFPDVAIDNVEVHSTAATR